MNSKDEIGVTLIDNDLPEGWALPRVIDLIELNYGKGLKESNRNVGSVPVYGSNGVVGRHDVELSKGPSIIIGRKGSVGAVQFSPIPCWPIDTTYYIDNFRGLNAQFLMHSLRSLDLANLDTSTAIPGLNRNDIYGQRIPLPPLAEQKRIMTKVEELLARVNATKERLAKVSTIMKRFRQAVLAAASSGRLTADWRDKNADVEPAFQQLKKLIEQANQESMAKAVPDLSLPNTWSFVLSKYLFSFVTSGSRGWAKYYSDEGPLFIRIGNLKHDTIYPNLNNVQRVRPPKGAEGTRTRVQPNDILVSITADVGMIALVPENIEEAYINQHIALARLIRDISSKYIAWFLASNDGGLKQFQELQRGMTKGGLGLDDIKSVWIPFPPLVEQHEIVRRVESMFKYADAVEKRVASATTRAEKLTQAILAKAFRGELVPTEAELARCEGRSYESASELLARIKSERESKGVMERRRYNKTYKGDP